jgi:hypothetical protein
MDASPSRFLCLPGEIRNMIYMEYIVSAGLDDMGLEPLEIDSESVSPEDPGTHSDPAKQLPATVP